MPKLKNAVMFYLQNKKQKTAKNLSLFKLLKNIIILKTKTITFFRILFSNYNNKNNRVAKKKMY